MAGLAAHSLASSSSLAMRCQYRNVHLSVFIWINKNLYHISGSATMQNPPCIDLWILILPFWTVSKIQPSIDFFSHKARQIGRFPSRVKFQEAINVSRHIKNWTSNARIDTVTFTAYLLQIELKRQLKFYEFLMVN